MIFGVEVKELNWIRDDRGKLAELYRESWFKSIRQIYCTTLKKGVIKDVDAWHLHRRQTDHMILSLRGKAQVDMVDLRKGSVSQGEKMSVYGGSGHPMLVVIPKGIAHKLLNMGNVECYIINCIDIEYNPENPDEARIPNEEVEV